MAKFYGSSVKTGKIGGSVFRVRFGETIETQYQPIVFNPNTEKQVSARARLKLLSQLAEVMAPVIAIPRMGAVSARNQFISVNHGATTYTGSQASVTLTSVSLTKSVLGLSPLVATTQDNNIAVSLDGATSLDVDRVVYSAFQRGVGNSIVYVGSVIATTAGGSNTYAASIPIGPAVGNNSYVIYAYGVRDNSENARVAFGNLQALTAETVAKLIVSRTLTESDVSLTITRSALLP